jgi:hypothetical protein
MRLTNPVEQTKYYSETLSNLVMVAISSQTNQGTRWEKISNTISVPSEAGLGDLPFTVPAPQVSHCKAHIRNYIIF